jgi:Protein of unknown function DUF262
MREHMNYNSTEHPLSWFRERYRDNTLKIKPPYQRKPVWAARQKCYLVESILMGLPVPEIYIQQTTSPEGETTYAIVDGQQRIRTVLQFIGSETDPDVQEFNKFVLDKLDDSSRWKNLSFADLEPEEKRTFYGYRFAVRYLNTDSDDEVRDMFRRLNKFLTPLKPQELRNATYMGPFIQLTEKLADSEYWAENRIVTAASIRRMGDVEFVSELLIGVLHGPQGGSERIVDEYYKQYEDYEDEFPEQRRTHKLFDETLATIQQILPDIKETRWSNKTDFYTLFVGVASLLRTHELPKANTAKVKKSLIEFEKEIDRRLGDEEANASKNAVDYVRAVEKGANDKRRRADRQEALLNVLRGFFKKRKAKGGRSSH